MSTYTTKGGTELPILNLKGKDYLEVKYRILWFREECPDWRIETEFVQIMETHAIAKAIIKNPAGEIVAMSHKREDKSHFQDYMEKAETSAIGRALALVGYGTQFTGDELDEGDRLADAPGAPARKNPHAPSNMQPGDDEGFPGYVGPYRFKTGKFKMRTPEEVPEKELKQWINWWDDQVLKGKKVDGALKEDLNHAAEHLANMENAPTESFDDFQKGK